MLVELFKQSSNPLVTIESKTKVKQDFSTVIEPIFRYQTANIFRACYWQKSHPLRERALTYFPYPMHSMLGDILLIPRIQTQVCTVTALNIFSLFVEARTNKNLYQSNAGQGLEEFQAIIKQLKECQGAKGAAFYCKLMGEENKQMGSFHEFVLELTPTGEFYLYQSYVQKYDLYQGLRSKQFGPWSESDLMKHLELVVSKEIIQDEKFQDAYYQLFNVSDEKLPQLELIFTSIEYDPAAIPTIPQEQSWFNFFNMREKMGLLWGKIFAYEQGES